ncbi:hypothetical protein ACFX2C_035000 [Malus domestica]
MWDYSFSKCMWLALPVGYPDVPHPSDMLSRMVLWVGYLSAPNFEICLMVLWAIWGTRNEKLWNDTVESPDIVLSHCL